MSAKMRKFGILTAQAILLTLLIHPASSAAPRACKEPGNIERDGLPSTPPVVFRDNSFFYRGSKYILTNFSESAKRPTPDSVFCFRYEIENRTKSKNPIDRVTWPLAKIKLQRLLQGPDNREPIVHFLDSKLPPFVDPTLIYAFLNVRLKTSAWKARDEVQRRPINRFQFGNRTHHGFIAVSVSSYHDSIAPMPLTNFPPSHNAVRVAQQSPGRPIVIPKIDTKFSLIGTTYGKAINRVQVQSRVRFEKDQLDFDASIQWSKERPKSVVAPYLVALDRAKDVKSIPGLLKEFRSVPIPFKDLKDPSKFPAQFSHKNVEKSLNRERSNVLFVVNQPVTIETPAGKVCFLSQMYSPAPISLTLADCDLDW